MAKALAEMIVRASSDKWQVLTLAEVKEVGFFPLENIQVGERLRAKTSLANSKIAQPGDIVEVYSVGPFPFVGEHGSPVDRDDFSVVCRIDETLIESTCDSRYWERVTE